MERSYAHGLEDHDRLLAPATRHAASGWGGRQDALAESCSWCLQCTPDSLSYSTVQYRCGAVQYRQYRQHSTGSAVRCGTAQYGQQGTAQCSTAQYRTNTVRYKGVRRQIMPQVPIGASHNTAGT